jgi:flagellin
MGFRINTNIAAMDAHQKTTLTNRGLDKSLGSLASGLRINSAADDASGLVIADSLRSQANSLGQAVRNANDAIGIIQTADKAMDEQIKILDTIKTKAIQAASDGQSASSREAIQKDVDRLISSLNNIAQTTSFNGQSLLSGKYTDKEFQVGAYSNQSVSASIGNTESVAIGNIQQTTDSSQLGNVVSTTAASGTGSFTISVAAADLNGLGRGDIISFEGSTSTYSVQEVISSSGTIELAVPLNEDIASGAKISVDTYANNPSGYLEIATGATGDTQITVDASQLKGLAVGDTVTIVNSLGTSDTLTINAMTSAGLISFGGGANDLTSVAAVGNLKMFVDSDATVSQTTLSAGASNLASTTLGVAAAGTGYAIGDVIEITNGVNTEQFVIEGVNTSNGTVTLNNAMA